MSDSMSQKLAAVSQFILQAPPGELNDVFNDVRAIISDDSALETGILPALEQYNTEQFAIGEVSGSRKVLICEPGKLKDGSGRFFDPESRQSFVYDHMRFQCSQFESHPIDESLEPLRSALSKETANYASEHYSSSASSVFAPLPAAKPALSAPAAPAAAKEEDGEDAAAGREAAEGEKADKPADAEATAEPEQAAEPKSEPLPRKFELRIVGNRYNPNNCWTGRWRSAYTVDAEKGEITGEIKVNCHYYEQGNVQLATNKFVSLEIPSTSLSSSPDQLASVVLRLIARAEEEYQNAVNDAYIELAEKTFKTLRRALPMSKQKLDWEKLASYNLGEELSKAGSF